MHSAAGGIQATKTDSPETLGFSCGEKAVVFRASRMRPMICGNHIAVDGAFAEVLLCSSERARRFAVARPAPVRERR